MQKAYPGAYAAWRKLWRTSHRATKSGCAGEADSRIGYTCMFSMLNQGPLFGRVQLLGYLSRCLIWGSTWASIRIVVRYVPPLAAAALRFLGAGNLLLALAAGQRRRWPRARTSGTRCWS